MGCNCSKGKRRKSKVSGMGISKTQNKLLRQTGLGVVGAVGGRLLSGALAKVTAVSEKPILKTIIKGGASVAMMLGQQNEDLQSAGVGLAIETVNEFVSDKGWVEKSVAGFYRSQIAGGNYLNGTPDMNRVHMMEAV